MFSSVRYLDGSKEDVQQVIRPGKVFATFQNGDTFEGNYISAGGNRGYVRNGKGVYLWKSGAKYDGQYKNGKREGHGLYTFPSGEVYDGNWENGLKSGSGKYIYTNGDVFYGIWSGDKRNGKGRFVYANNVSEIIGEWKDGDLIEETYREISSNAPVKEAPKVEEVPVPVAAVETPKQASKVEEPVEDVVEKVKSVEEQVEPKEESVEKVEVVEKVETPRSAVVAPTPVTMASGEPLGIIIAGAPASGKGTQCENIKSEYGVVHLSSGDILRDTVNGGSEVGLKAKEYMERGELVPDDIVIAAVQERLSQDDVKCRGFLLDGFPRSAVQAQELHNMGVKVHVCIMLSVDEEALIERAVGRRMDPVDGKIYHMKFLPPPNEEVLNRLVQRADDNEETMRNRIKIFNDNVSHLKEFYAEVSHEVDGNRDKNEIWDDINEKLKSLINAEQDLGVDGDIVEKSSDPVDDAAAELKTSSQEVTAAEKSKEASEDVDDGNEDNGGEEQMKPVDPPKEDETEDVDQKADAAEVEETNVDEEKPENADMEDVDADPVDEGANVENDESEPVDKDAEKETEEVDETEASVQKESSKGSKDE